MKGVLVLILFIANGAFAKEINCEKVVFSDSHGSTELSNTAVIDSELGHIRISAGKDVPSTVRISDKIVFDFSAPAIIYRKENCALVTRKRSSSRHTTFNNNCLSDKGIFRLFSRLSFDDNMEDIQDHGRLIVTYFSVFDGAAGRSTQTYTMSKCN